jgi:hypothetical protein
VIAPDPPDRSCQKEGENGRKREQDLGAKISFGKVVRTQFVLPYGCKPIRSGARIVLLQNNSVKKTQQARWSIIHVYLEYILGSTPFGMISFTVLTIIRSTEQRNRKS